MQQLMILLVINSPSTCFGRLYAHRQEVRLRFHCLSFSVLLWLSNITTVTTGQKMIGSENAVWPPDDGRKDARNMLRDYWLPIKSLIVASSWSHLYLLTLYLFAITEKCKPSHTGLYLGNCPERHKIFDVGNCLTVNWALLLMELSGVAL